MKKRIWEIDFLRGILIIAVVFDHFMYDWLAAPNLFNNFSVVPEWMKQIHYFARFYWHDDRRMIIRESALALFFLLSGISCAFSRSNIRRGLKLVIFGLIITLATYIVYFIDPTTNIIIIMGAISCFGNCILIYGAFELLFQHVNINKKIPQYFYLIVGILLLIISINWGLYPQRDIEYLKTWNVNTFFSFIFGKLAYGSGDYFGLLPYLSYIFIGAFIGKTVYRDKLSKFKRVENNKFLITIGAVGRKTIWIYLLSQAILYPFVIFLIYLGGARI